MIMTVGDKVLIVLRLLVLVSALVVVGLGAWCKLILKVAQYEEHLG